MNGIFGLAAWPELKKQEEEELLLVKIKRKKILLFRHFSFSVIIKVIVKYLVKLAAWAEGGRLAGETRAI